MSVVIPRQLTYALAEVSDNYRPAKFRQVLQTRSDIPEWADNVEIRKVVEYAEIEPITDMTSGNLPQPSLSRSTSNTPMIEMGAAYRYTDREIKKAARLQMRLDVSRARANNRKAEQLLDQIAASGDPFGLGLGGLGNNSDVPTVTALTKAAGGTTWALATADEVLEDMHELAWAPHENTNETHKADTMILPVAQFKIATRLRVGDGSDTVLSVFREQNPDIQRILIWNRFSVLGAGVTPRACAFDSQSEEVARMLISRDFTAQAPRRVSLGWEVDQTMITGGVLIQDAKGIAYMDAL